MHLAGRTQMIDRLPYGEAVKFYLDMGFEGVELNNINWDFSRRDEFFDPRERKRLKEALKDSRLRGFSVGSHMDYVYDDDRYRTVVESMDAANDLGTDLVIINGCASKEGREREWDTLRDRTASLCSEAEKRGVRLCMEFEPGFICRSTAQLLDLMAEVDSPALYANLDLGHVFLGDDNPLGMIKKIGPRIAHCHIENMAAGVHNHLPFDQGDMDLAAYLSALRDAGFDGQLSFDYYNEAYLEECPRSIGIFRELSAQVGLA